MLRLKKAIVEFAFLEMLFTGLLQEKLQLMVTPMYTVVYVISCRFFGCIIDYQRWRTLETGNREYTFICKLWHVYLHPATSHRR